MSGPSLASAYFQASCNNKVDWRRNGAINIYQVIEIPNRIIQLCFNLMDELNLPFGAFDFIKVGTEYFFLEVNPKGQWLWLEQFLRIPISRSVVTHMMREVNFS